MKRIVRGTLTVVGVASVTLLLAKWIALADGERMEERHRMVRSQIAARGVNDPLVLDALRAVPRHEFVPAALAPLAYADQPLPIGSGQTISQPYIVGLMTELLALAPGHRVLEIGTGSGYQAAVLTRITADVYTIEIVPELHGTAAKRLAAYGLGPDRVILGDGYRGLPAAAPFDAIIVTAAPDHVPPALVDQLKPGGRLVIPVGRAFSVQRLLVVEKDADGTRRDREIIPVQFVPLTGEAERATAPDDAADRPGR